MSLLRRYVIGGRTYLFSHPHLILYALLLGIIVVRISSIVPPPWPETSQLLPVRIEVVSVRGRQGRWVRARVRDWGRAEPVGRRYIDVYWPQAQPRPRVGEWWQVSLTAPWRSRANPGRRADIWWNISGRVSARFSIPKFLSIQRIAASSGSLQQRLRDGLIETISGARHAGLMQALVSGDNRRVPQSTLERLRRSGTAHLLAVSGAHLGMLSALFALPILGLWRVWGGRARTTTRALLSSYAALLASVVYLVLSAAALSMLRAAVLLWCALLLLHWRRRTPATLLRSFFLTVAVLTVLVPWAWLGPGIWLSLSAVAGIFLCLARLRTLPWWGQGAALSLVCQLATAPASLYFFGYSPLEGCVANLFAVPWVAFLVMPALFIGLILALCGLDWALVPADYALDGLLAVLHVSGQIAWPIWQWRPSALAALALGGAVLLLLAPLAWRLRCGALGCLALLILRLQWPDPIAACRLHVLDHFPGALIWECPQGSSVYYRSESARTAVERYRQARAIHTPLRWWPINAPCTSQSLGDARLDHQCHVSGPGWFWRDSDRAQTPPLPVGLTVRSGRGKQITQPAVFTARHCPEEVPDCIATRAQGALVLSPKATGWHWSGWRGGHGVVAANAAPARKFEIK